MKHKKISQANIDNHKLLELISTLCLNVVNYINNVRVATSATKVVEVANKVLKFTTHPSI